MNSPLRSGPSLKPSLIASPARAVPSAPSGGGRDDPTHKAQNAYPHAQAPPADRHVAGVAVAADAPPTISVPSQVSPIALATAVAASRATELKYSAVLDALQRVAHGHVAHGQRGGAHGRAQPLQERTSGLASAPTLLAPTPDRLGMGRKWRGPTPRGAVPGQLTSSAMRTARASILGLSSVR